jgi:hypothetical protein
MTHFPFPVPDWISGRPTGQVHYPKRKNSLCSQAQAIPFDSKGSVRQRTEETIPAVRALA